MWFKYPYVLWAFGLLAIPIFIHLFNLRRYRPIKFTNVAFLEAVLHKSRKGSQLQRWLALICRILALSALVLAFAQPQSRLPRLNKKDELVIYLDTSFSMQARSGSIVLLEKALNDLLQHLPPQANFSLFTNAKTFRNTTKDQLSETLLRLDYDAEALDTETILARGAALFSPASRDDVSRYLILISDFKNFKPLPDTPTPYKIIPVALTLPDYNNNIALMKAAIKTSSKNERFLEIALYSDLPETSALVSINSDSLLLAKLQVNFADHRAAIRFQLSDYQIPKGQISIRDEALVYDNVLYFSIAPPKQIHVLSINGSDDSFVKKMFEGSAFEFVSKFERGVDYSRIARQDLIILNGLSGIDKPLQIALSDFISKGGHLVLIPSEKARLEEYNALLKGMAVLNPMQKITLKINDISFSHPLYQDVFTKRITNFKYPEVFSFFPSHSTKITPALNFENGQPFLLSDDRIHVFTAPIGLENSNFLNSPLLAITFYNMAKHSFKYAPLYHTIFERNQVDVEASPAQDETLQLIDGPLRFTPLQEPLSNKIRFFTSTLPNKAANYEILKGNTSLGFVSYNFPREESFGTAPPLNDKATSIEEAFKTIQNEKQESQIWRWLAAAALLFLLIEMSLLKIIK